MKSRYIFISVIFSILLLSFKSLDKERNFTLSEVVEGNSTYVLKCNKHLNIDNDYVYQYYLEIYSEKDPKTNFKSDFEYASYTQFNLNQLFTIKRNGESLKVLGARLEQGIKGTNVYRINIYFEKDSSKKIKNLELNFDDRLFENKKILLTAKKVNL